MAFITRILIGFTNQKMDTILFRGTFRGWFRAFLAYTLHQTRYRMRPLASKLHYRMLPYSGQEREVCKVAVLQVRHKKFGMQGVRGRAMLHAATLL